MLENVFGKDRDPLEELSCISAVACLESVVSSCSWRVSVVLSVVPATMALSTLRAPKRARRGGVPTPSGMPNNLGINPLMMMLNPMANPMAAMMGQSMNPMAAMMGQAMNQGHQVVPVDEEAETESEPEAGSRAAGQSQSSGHRLSMTSQSSGSQPLEVEGAAATPRPVEPDVPIYPVVRPDDPAQEEFNARRQAETFISRNVTYIKNIPRQHLAFCMEYINPRIDMSFTSECSPNGLLALLWLYCRVKPCIRVLTDLRCLDLLTDP